MKQKSHSMVNLKNSPSKENTEFVLSNSLSFIENFEVAADPIENCEQVNLNFGDQFSISN